MTVHEWGLRVVAKGGGGNLPARITELVGKSHVLFCIGSEKMQHPLVPEQANEAIAQSLRCGFFTSASKIGGLFESI